jgi:hypothetical protein
MAPVVAAPLVSFDLLAGSSHFWAKAWSFIQGRWTKEGSSISPNGTPVEGGSEIDPNGAATAEGSSISPDGRTKEGAGISPNGHTKEGGSISPDG